MKYLGPPQSGSQAGTTASHNRAGQYFRNRRKPVTPTRTPRQTTLRSQFGTAATAYQSLTTAEQAAWTAFAHSYPIKDALGQTITLTGQQMFVAINTSLLNAGQTIRTSPPVNVTVNPITPVTIYADATGVFFCTFTPGTSGDFVLGAQSKLLSGGVAFNKTFTQVAVVDASTGFVDFSATFAAQWGAITVGRTLFARLTPVNSDGRSLPGVIISTKAIATGTGTPPTAATSTGGNTVYTFTPTPADILLLQRAPSSTGPWTTVFTTTSEASPATIPTSGALNWYRAAVFKAGIFSGWSTPQVGS